MVMAESPEGSSLLLAFALRRARGKWLGVSVAGLCVEGAFCHPHHVLVAACRTRGDAINVNVDLAGAAVVGTSDARLVLGTGTRRLHQAHVFDDVARVGGYVRAGDVGLV